MWAAVPEIAMARAGYSLTFRRGLPETEAGNQLVMAGHEAMLAQWFHRPLKRGDIELARRWYAERSAVKVFPHTLWDAILKSQPGDDIFLPVDVFGLGHHAPVVLPATLLPLPRLVVKLGKNPRWSAGLDSTAESLAAFRPQ